MKKLFALLFCVIIAGSVFSQGTKFGLVIRPQFASMNPETPSTVKDTVEWLGTAGKFRFAGGIVLDMHFSENAAFGLGLLFNTKGSEITVKPRLDPSAKDSVINFNVQYLEIPVTLKLFTNEIGGGARIYGQIGSGVNIKIAAKGGKTGEDKDFLYTDLTTGASKAKEYSDYIAFLDATFKFTVGIELALGGDTRFFAGLQYDRGLLNALSPQTGIKGSIYDNWEKDVAIKNNCFGLEMGIKF